MSIPERSIGGWISENRGAIAFFSALSAIYFFFPTKNYYWDGIIYAQLIEDTPGFGWHLLHPNHLFYNALGYSAYRAVQAMGFQTRALFVLQFLTTVFAVICSVIFFLISLRLFRSRYMSFVLTSILAFAAGWWRFATDADVYIISLAFLLAALYFVLPSERPRPFLVAIVHSFAMFFHELAVLFFPVLVLGLAVQTESGDVRRKIRVLLQYSLTAFFLTFGIYCSCFYFLTGNFNAVDFFRWTTSFAPDPGVVPTVSESLQQTLKGHRQLFIDGSSKLLNLDLLSITALVIFCIAAAGLIFSILKNTKDIKIFFGNVIPGVLRHKRTILLTLVWFLSYSLFLWFFMPGNLFYRLFYFPALVLLIGAIFAGYNDLGRNRHWGLALLAVAFGSYNFVFYIYPNSKVIEGTPLEVAITANSFWPEGTSVLYASPNPYGLPSTNDRLVRYFNPSTDWKRVDTLTSDDLERYLNDHDHQLWAESNVLEPTTSGQIAQWLNEHFEIESPPEMSSPRYKLAYIRLVRRVQN